MLSVRNGSLPLLAAFVLCSISTGNAQRSPDLTGKLSALLGAQGRLLWIDGTANLFRTVKNGSSTRQVNFTTTLEGVREIVQHSRAAGINTLVIDVKPLGGEVLYRSKLAPRLRSWKGQAVPDFDVLDAFIKEGHNAGLRVCASINTLSEGHKYFKTGPAYQHPDRQSLVFAVDRGLIASDGFRLPTRASGEPGEEARPVIYGDDTAIHADASGLIGLEGGEVRQSPETTNQLGKQLCLALGPDNRAIGIIDSGLLGDDPLTAPEDGRLAVFNRSEDQGWLQSHIKAGQQVRFDLRTSRTPIASAAGEKVACFMNPLHPEVRKYVLDIVKELISNYDIDGLALDRCRYSSMYSDFSDLSRDAFVRWLSNQNSPKHLTRWPEDIFSFSAQPGLPLVQGPLYREWLEFRSGVMRELVGEIAKEVRGLKPDISLGSYVGGWYPQYYEVGVNWGSPNTQLRYSWFTPEYPRTGYVEYLDWISTGCYFPTATREDARRQEKSEKATVEFAAELASQSVANGSYLYPGIYVADYAGRPDDFIRALKTASMEGQGWMIFDLSYLEDYGWWPNMSRAFGGDTPQAPHAFPEVLSSIRAVMSGISHRP